MTIQTINLLTFARIESNGAWVNFGRNTYSYDNSNNLLTTIIEIWSGGAWANFQKATNTYDNSGNTLLYSL